MKRTILAIAVLGLLVSLTGLAQAQGDFQPAEHGSANMAFSTGGAANHVSLIAIVGPYSRTSFIFKNIAFDVTTADAGGLYSVGLYGPCAPGAASCPLVCATAAATASSGVQDLACGSGEHDLPVQDLGQYYYYATTGNATTAALASASLVISPVCSTNAATSSGGALPSTITIPSASWATCNQPVMRLHY